MRNHTGILTIEDIKTYINSDEPQIARLRASIMSVGLSEKETGEFLLMAFEMEARYQATGLPY
jgi:hypothetical protein